MKGQVSLEFLILLSVLILVATVTFLTSGTFQTNVFEERVYSSAMEVCKKVSSEINRAIKIGDGYERDFSLEEKLFGGIDYSVEIKNYSVIVRFDDKFASCSTLAESINGEIKKGKNVIKNENGEIYVE